MIISDWKKQTKVNYFRLQNKHKVDLPHSQVEKRKRILVHFRLKYVHKSDLVNFAIKKHMMLPFPIELAKKRYIAHALLKNKKTCTFLLVWSFPVKTKTKHWDLAHFFVRGNKKRDLVL